MNKKIFIGLSWPYANGELHIGHIGSSMPADILARYYRLNGDSVCFVSGSDCYGTPTSIQAQMENINPMSIADCYHEKFSQTFEKMNFSFDNYYRTTEVGHINFAMDFHKKLYNSPYVYDKTITQLCCEKCNRFLPDRYVKGICPYCHSEAKGDSCDKCGKILEPEDLLEPKCSICGSTPVMKSTSQKYIKLSAFQKELTDFYEARKDSWTINSQMMTLRYLKEGLVDRAITRNLDWGVPVPDCDDDNKKIYNWAENVLGYLSASKVYCEKNGLNYEDWWKNSDAKHYYVHAKDNIPFHTLILPGLLMAEGENYHLPDVMVASEYITIEGKKISKSKGTALTVREMLEYFDTDFVRYYFARNINDRKDVNFTFMEFVNTVNGELINNWGNFVNRTLSFIKNKMDGELPEGKLNSDIEEKIKTTFDSVKSLIEDGKISLALKEIMDLVSFSNKYFDEGAPWTSFKNDIDKCKAQCYEYVCLIENIAIMLQPFIPQSSEKVLNFLNEKDNTYKYHTVGNIVLSDISALYQRLDMNIVKEQFKTYCK